MGNWYNTYFWLDSMVGDGVILSEKFPRLFRLEANKNVTVGEMREWSGVEWSGYGDGDGLGHREVEVRGNFCN